MVKSTKIILTKYELRVQDVRLFVAAAVLFAAVLSATWATCLV
jgi:hypothetical protein